jgi:hypothetical protein
MVKKIIGGVIAAFVVLAIIGSLIGSDKKKPGGTSSSAAPAASQPETVNTEPGALAAQPSATTAPEPKAQIVLRPAKSLCVPDPTQAKIHFFLTFANTGGAKGSVTARPWRRFDDANVSDGAFEDYKITVGPHVTYKTTLDVDWDARKHYPIACAVALDERPRVTIPVVSIG